MSRAVALLLLITVATIFSTQYATVSLSVSANVVTNQTGLIWFGAGDKAGDGVYALRAPSNGAQAYLFFWKIPPSSSKEYTQAFAIVNEEAFDIMITKIDVQSIPTGFSVSVWLDDDGNPGNGRTTAFDGSPHTLSYVLNAGDGDDTTVVDSSGTSQSVSYDGSSHTKPLDPSWVGSDGSSSTQSDFVWVDVMITVDGTVSSGDYSFTIVVYFQSAS